MIDAAAFPGDDNEFVKRIQRDMYLRVLGSWAEQMTRRLTALESLFGIRTVAGLMLEHCERFDDRILRAPYEIIASYFRFRFAPVAPLFTEQGFPDFNWRCEWSRWSSEEFDRLLCDTRFFRLVVTALGFGNTPTGLAAELAILEWLCERYSDMPRGRSIARLREDLGPAASSL